MDHSPTSSSLLGESENCSPGGDETATRMNTETTAGTAAAPKKDKDSLFTPNPHDESRRAFFDLCGKPLTPNSGNTFNKLSPIQEMFQPRPNTSVDDDNHSNNYNDINNLLWKRHDLQHGNRPLLSPRKKTMFSDQRASSLIGMSTEK